MLENIVVGLLTGLITGVLSGYYSGLVVTRTARFNSLLRDAERALKQVEYMQEADGVVIRGFDRKAMDRAADDLAADRQVAASIDIRAQLHCVIDEIERAKCELQLIALHYS
ncbi:hypothetical protein [Stenotrophomonas sp. S41]|uniref:hypothetical protein n=1 Tax=Stenotrophomonas sp. S41 TaxID=2767464 RepID=UPI00190BB06C|nr:hypothetical protein [Stenotrophomonas sp. S41]MBK0010775.1 hypothetical protein [Stenotrophomonas sp. S41]